MGNVVIVESKYKQAFESVRNILKMLSGRPEWDALVSARAVKNGIADGDTEYVLGAERAETDERTTSRKVGAWFEGVRKYDLVSQKSRWETLMESVSGAYHKLYSLVEYKEKKSDADDARLSDEAKTVAEKIFGAFAPELVNEVECRRSSVSPLSDYYGVTLRVDMSGSTGASVPVLCKAYFQGVKNVLTPLDRDQAFGIDAYLKSCVEEAARTHDDGIVFMSADSREDEDVIRGTITAVDRLLKSGGESAVTFEDAVFFAGEEDEREVVQLVTQTAHNGATIKAVGAKILGISHVKWHEQAFDVCRAGKPIYRLAVELGDVVSLTCASCGKRIIDKDIITYTDTDGLSRSVRLHYAEKNCGVTKDELDAISESLFKKHNYLVRCPNNFRNKSCSRLLCLNDDSVFMREDISTGKLRPYCKDCPYTEIVYTDADGKQHYTPAMSYATDVGDMVETGDEPIKYCASCGRKITKGSRCALCIKSSKSINDEEARKTYKRYGAMLPLSERVFVSPKQKRAYEDSEIILFVIGEKRYLVRKAELKDSGLNGKPERL